MQNQNDARSVAFAPSQERSIGVSTQADKVLRNTYMLLAMTLAFSAITAGVSMMLNIGFINPFVTIGIYFGLLFATSKTQDSALGLVFVFALTGWLGFTLGPILNVYTATAAGSQLVMTALAGTAFIFFGLSGFVLVTRKDFSFLTNFIVAGCIVALLAVVGSLFFNIPGLQLALSCAFLLLSSAIILWQTSNIIHGGETNYISATVTLYVSLYNIFLSLLQLLSAFGSDD